MKIQIDCETCDTRGRVQVHNRWSVDKGTKWERHFEEFVYIDCPDCDGRGHVEIDYESS